MVRKAYTVSQLNTYLKLYLRSDEVLQDVWISGEISNFHRHASGHCYFTLKDEKSTLKAVLFKSQANNIKFNLESGISVLVRGFIDVYEARGEYQIYVHDMEPAGIGALYLAYEKLKEKLEKEGLFSQEFKKEIPFFPTKIGVVTSPTGAVIKDIISVLERRFKGLSILIAPARVQGEGASEEVIDGIKSLETFDVDLIIVARGGGSLEELWVFNDEKLARTVFSCPIPIISAIGHERDYTIIDFVADRRAATPTEAAELVIGPRAQMKQSVDGLKKRLENNLINLLASKKNELHRLLHRRAFSHPYEFQYMLRQRLDDYSQRLSYSMSQTIKINTEIFKTKIAQLEGLSPLKIMSLGYSICRNPVTFKVIKTSHGLKIGEDLELIFETGKAQTKVTKIEDSQEQ